MPKLKTHKGTLKRVRKTGSGKLLRLHAFGGHELSKKSSARKRRIGKSYSITGRAAKTINKKLGNNQ